MGEGVSNITVINEVIADINSNLFIGVYSYLPIRIRPNRDVSIVSYSLRMSLTNKATFVVAHPLSYLLLLNK